jgi:hypothetical protein
MPMRKFSLLVAALSLAAAVTGLAAAQSVPVQHKKTVGYQDETGAFHPMAHVVPDAGITPTTGTYEVTFDIAIDSSFPAKSTIVCSIAIIQISESAAGAISHQETSTSTVSLSGKTATCKVNLPYSWAIPASTTKAPVVSQVGGSYTVSVFNTSSTAVTLSSIEGLRTSSGGLSVPATIPKNDAVTAITVNVTL